MVKHIYHSKLKEEKLNKVGDAGSIRSFFNFICKLQNAL